MFREYIEFEKADDFLSYFLSWKNDLSDFIFRGHSSDKYKLIPSSLREGFEKYIIPYRPTKTEELPKEFLQIMSEFVLLRDFYLNADRQGLRVPHSMLFRDNKNHDIPWSLVYSYNAPVAFMDWIHDDLEEAAGLAQHYGVPTRLLDWTYDPFIACYFALNGAIGKDGMLEIWCLNKTILSKPTSFSDRDTLHFTTPPYFDNPNLNAQKGLFTHVPRKIPKNKFNYNEPDILRVKPLDEIIEERFQPSKPDEEVFRIIKLPCCCAKDAYKLLEAHGYGVDRVFPGYQGIADKIISKYQDKNSK